MVSIQLPHLSCHPDSTASRHCSQYDTAAISFALPAPRQLVQLLLLTCRFPYRVLVILLLSVLGVALVTQFWVVDPIISHVGAILALVAVYLLLLFGHGFFVRTVAV
jgi:hypothetical protein